LLPGGIALGQVAHARLALRYPCVKIGDLVGCKDIMQAFQESAQDNALPVQVPME
jgi:hypothetical protein